MNEETNEIDRVALKKQAKQLLDGKVFKMLLCYALYGIIVVACFILCFFLPNPLEAYLASTLGELQVFSSVLTADDIRLIIWAIFLVVRLTLLMALVHPFSVCITTVPLAIIEGRPLSWRMALAPIQKLRHFIECMIAGVAQFLSTLLWSVLLVVPGVITFYRHSFTKYLFIENNEQTFSETAERSKSLARGYEGQLFFRDLSFLGWLVFGICTCGIGLLYLVCYYSVTKALYYKEIKRMSQEEETARQSPSQNEDFPDSSENPDEPDPQDEPESPPSAGGEPDSSRSESPEATTAGMEQDEGLLDDSTTDDSMVKDEGQKKAPPDATLWTKDSDKGIRIARGDMTNLEQEAQNNLRNNKEDSV